MKFTSKNLIITLTVAILMVSVLVDVASARTCQEQNGRCQRRRCFPRIRVSGSGCPPEQSRCCRGVGAFIGETGGADINIDIPLQLKVAEEGVGHAAEAAHGRYVEVVAVLTVEGAVVVSPLDLYQYLTSHLDDKICTKFYWDYIYKTK
ncbi:unnamed protein product [Orchesella dallaii]|uniref:Uncharacterized protein n=1 Tax=Orchesella dallaii TaxID=48710 RepID=A0ABP1RZV5_9HEXA